MASTMVDSVFFLEGANDGSYAARAKIHGVEWVNGWESDPEANPLRPAFVGLLPASPWYQWANLDSADLPDLPYFTFAADLGAQAKQCGWFWESCEPVGPRTEFGDGLLKRGTSYPFDTPPAGGAKFLYGSPDAQNWEWVAQEDVTSGLFGLQEGAWLATHPAAHWNFETHMDNIDVEDCKEHTPAKLLPQLVLVISGRMSGTHYNCVPLDPET